MFPQGLSGEALSKSLAKVEYLKSPIMKCPNCGEEFHLATLTGIVYSIDSTPRQIHQKLVCRECGAKWRETFTLTDVEFTTEWT